MHAQNTSQKSCYIYTTIVRIDCENSEEEEQYSSEHQEEDKVANVDIHDSEVTKEAGRSKPCKTKGNVGHYSEQTTINELGVLIHH